MVKNKRFLLNSHSFNKPVTVSFRKLVAPTNFLITIVFDFLPRYVPAFLSFFYLSFFILHSCFLLSLSWVSLFAVCLLLFIWAWWSPMVWWFMWLDSSIFYFIFVLMHWILYKRLIQNLIFYFILCLFQISVGIYVLPFFLCIVMIWYMCNCCLIWVFCLLDWM